MPKLKAFVDAWCLAFNEPPDDCATLSGDFAGVHHDRHDLDSCSLSSDGAIESLKTLLLTYPHDARSSTDFPLAGDSLPKLRLGATPDNPLLTDMLTPARRFMGIICFVVNVRPDALFASKVLARYTNESRLTVYAWSEIRRLAAYLVSTCTIRLTLHRTSGTLVAFVDSSLVNADDSTSWGGFSLAFSSSTPNSVTEATDVAELHQAIRVTKVVIGARILLRELHTRTHRRHQLPQGHQRFIDARDARKASRKRTSLLFADI
jgi:hypothetical protein